MTLQELLPAQKVQKHAESERDGVIPTKLQFQSILNTDILVLSKHYESTEVVKNCLHVPSVTLWSTRRNEEREILLRGEGYFLVRFPPGGEAII